MRVLLVHPSALMYSELYLRLEPLGLERVAAAVRAAGHDVRLLDLQIFTHDDYRRDLEARRDAKLSTLPGVVTQDGQGPAPTLLDDLDRFLPARDLAHKRHKYFIGVLDPCASAELTRGCPWDCSFCSAWTFYGRSYRKASPEKAAEDLASIAEPNVFL